MTARRAALVLMMAITWMVMGASPASADPPGPTDYDTDLVEIDPPRGGFVIEIIGGDSFVRLTSETAEIIEVIGYRGEPYLRFLPGGIVEENQNSPTTYLNIDRYAEVDIPAQATPDATPAWKQVASDGAFAWHDHRAHWMNSSRPVGRGPGDVILEGVVPLLVDGTEVDLAVASVWQEAPSPVPVILGAVLGLAAAVALIRKQVRALAIAVAIVGVAATVAGLTAYLSVPPETGPAWSLWVPPAAATVLALSTLIPGKIARPLRNQAATLTLLAAVILVIWGVIRWDWLWAAILPTALPFWMDRLITAFSLTAGAGVLALAIRSTVKPPDAA